MEIMYAKDVTLIEMMGDMERMFGDNFQGFERIVCGDNFNYVKVDASNMVNSQPGRNMEV